MSDESKKGKPEGAHGEPPVLTNRQGHPVYDNQNTRTVGERGPTVLENYQFLEKITHFDRERIPECVAHARGAGVHGYFEAYGTIGDEPASKYTRAKLFQEKGKRTPVFVRFSTVIHGGLVEAPRAGKDHTPFVSGHVVRRKLARTNDFAQAGERYRTMPDWEREDLVTNLVDALKQCNDDMQERMVGLLSQCDEDYGRRVAEGLGRSAGELSASSAAD